MSEKIPLQPAPENSGQEESPAEQLSRLSEAGILHKVADWIKEKKTLRIYRESIQGWQNVTAYEVGYGGLSTGVSWMEDGKQKAKHVDTETLAKWQEEAEKIQE